MICCVYHRAFPSSYQGSPSCCCCCCCAEVGCEMLRALDYVLQEINQIVWCYAVKVESCHMCPRSCIRHNFVLRWHHQRSVRAWTAQPRVQTVDQLIQSDSYCYCFFFLNSWLQFESRPSKGIALISPAHEHMPTAPCLFWFARLVSHDLEELYH